MLEKKVYTPPIVEKEGERYIPEVLTKHYKADKIHTKHVEALDDRTIRSIFIFPEYDRTIKNLGHVSMAQMHEGLMESLYACVQHVSESGAMNSDVSKEDFVNIALHAIYKHESIEFTQMKQSGETATLETTLSLVEVSESGRFQKATFRINGFMKGEVVCLLPNML